MEVGWLGEKGCGLPEGKLGEERDFLPIHCLPRGIHSLFVLGFLGWVSFFLGGSWRFSCPLGGRQYAKL